MKSPFFLVWSPFFHGFSMVKCLSHHFSYGFPVVWFFGPADIIQPRRWATTSELVSKWNVSGIWYIYIGIYNYVEYNFDIYIYIHIVYTYTYTYIIYISIILYILSTYILYTYIYIIDSEPTQTQQESPFSHRPIRPAFRHQTFAGLCAETGQALVVQKRRQRHRCLRRAAVGEKKRIQHLPSGNLT